MPISAYAASMSATPALAAVDGPADPPPARQRSAPTGCTCREVVVDADNIVRNADVRSGDSEVTNSSITYISPSYGDDEVEVDQDAEARSGHAIAGQILSVDAGEGCSRVRVRARNIVEESEVRSGDAVAKNKSVVLLDPRIKREDLEIDIDQDAEAVSGDAIAGQIIGVRGGGGPCGGVIVEALNRVRQVDVRSGDALTFNQSDIVMCTSPGCIDDLRELLSGVDTVQLCAGDDCEDVAVADFVDMLENRPDELHDDPDDDDDDEDEDEDEDRDEERIAFEQERRARLAKKRKAADRRVESKQETATDTPAEAAPAEDPPAEEPPAKGTPSS
jgi:hypothetical protein